MSTTISGTNGVTFPDSTSMQTGQQACKAWVNFNGIGTVAIRESYNVSSITDNGNGNYTVNFTTAMPDTNYSLGQSVRWGTAGDMSGSYGVGWVEIARTTTAMQTGSVNVWGTYPTDQTIYDRDTVCIQIFR